MGSPTWKGQGAVPETRSPGVAMDAGNCGTGLSPRPVAVSAPVSIEAGNVGTAPAAPTTTSAGVAMLTGGLAGDPAPAPSGAGTARDGAAAGLSSQTEFDGALRHVGLYAYRVGELKRITRLAPSSLEQRTGTMRSSSRVSRSGQKPA